MLAAWPVHVTQKVPPGPSAVSPSTFACILLLALSRKRRHAVVNVHKSSCELSHILVRHRQTKWRDNIQISVKVPDTTFHEVPTSGNQVFTCGHASGNNKRDILVGNQLDAQFLSMTRLFESSTCFEQLCAHPQEDKCVSTSGIITLYWWPDGIPDGH